MKNFLISTAVLFSLLSLASNQAAYAQCPTQANVLVKTHTDISCFGASDGTITVDIDNTSTSEPFNYELFDLGAGTIITLSVTEVEDKPNRSVVYSNVPSGTYAVLFFKTGCAPNPLTIIEPPFGFVIDEPTELDITINDIDPDCDPTPGIGNGQIDLTVTGGSAPYGITWTGPTAIPNDTEVTATNLDAGTYNISIMDANGCTFNQDIAVPVSTQADAGPPTGLTCGTNSFALSANAAGAGEIGTWSGPGGVSFTPNANDPNATVNNLSVGLNTLTWTITDMGGICLGTSDNIDVTFSNVQLTVSPNVVLDCFGDSDGAGTFTITGGIAPFTWTQISNTANATFVLPAPGPTTVVSFTGAEAGVVTLEVEDASGCTSQVTITITQPLQVTFGTTQTNVSCFGGSDGSITVTAAGGTGPYEFSSNNGGSFTAGANPFTFTALTAGGYDIVVRDANGCTSTATLVTITQPASALTFGTTQTNVSCFGGSDGSITVTAAGGTGPYEFSSNNGGSFTAGANPFTFTALTAGGYDIVVRDANGCTSAATLVTITQPATALNAVTTTVTDVVCTGDNTGAIDITVTGGTSGYTFLWSNGDVTEDVVGLVAGTYSVEVTDANSCTFDLINIVVDEPPVGIVITSTAKVDATCAGVDDGSIQVTGVFGGTPGYEYSLDGSSFQLSNVFTGLAPGSYSVVARDVNLCVSVPATIDILSGVTFSPSATFTDATCSGVDDGTIQVNSVSGGQSPYTYSIDGGSNFQVSNSFTGLAQGNYDVVAEDANGCLSTIQVVSIGAGLLFDPTATPTDASCSGVNDGSILVTGTTGGTSPFEYSNDGGSNFQVSDTFTGLATGSYDIVVRDANGCLSTTLPVTVGSGLSFDPTATPTDASCSGVNDGSILVTGTTGGISPFEYSNDGGSNFQVSDTFTGLATGSYDIVVRDANGCFSTTLTIIVNAALSISTTVGKTDATCLGNDGSITINSVTGGTGPYEYSINNGSTFQVSNVFNPVSVGNYNVVVRDANLCQSGVTPITINLPGGCGGVNCFAFTILPPVLQRPSCSDQNDGEVSLDITGQVAGNYIISILSGGVAVGPPQIGPSGIYNFTSLSPGDYQYRVQDQAGNVCVQDFTLLVETTVDAEAAGFVDAACFGEATGQATITVLSGGASPYDYSIDGTNWVLNVTSPILITNLPPNGTYSILVRDDATDQCPDEVSVTIGNGLPEIDIELSSTSATCGNSDGTIVIDTPPSGAGGGPYSFLLDGVSIDPVGNAFANQAGGNHTLTVIDDNSGCEREFSINIPFPGFVETAGPSFEFSACTFPTVRFQIIDPTSSTYEVGYTTNFFEEPDNFSSLFYNSTSNLITLPNLPRGTYYVWIRPSNAQCVTRLDPFDVVEGPYAITFEIGCRETNGDLTLFNIVGAPGIPFSYEIFSTSSITGMVNVDPLGNAVVSGFTTGTYQIRLSQDQSAIAGCIVTTSFFGAPTGSLDILSADTQESFPDQPTGSMLVKIQESGSEPYDVWAVENSSFVSSDTLVAVRNPVIYEANFTNLSAGSYSVFVEDARGCRKEIIVDLPFDEEIFIPNIFTPNNDGVNEEFYVRNLPPSGSKLSITNRWGKEVYSSSNYNFSNLWNGSGSPDGVYFYRLQISGGKTYTGWVEILRGIKP